MAEELKKEEARVLLDAALLVLRNLRVEMYDKPASNKMRLWQLLNKSDLDLLVRHITTAEYYIFKKQSPELPDHPNLISIDQSLEDYEVEHHKLIQHSKKWKQQWRIDQWNRALKNIDKHVRKSQASSEPRKQIHGNYSLRTATWLLAQFLFWQYLPSHKDILSLAVYTKEVRKHGSLISSATINMMVDRFNEIAQKDLQLTLTLTLAQSRRGKRASTSPQYSYLIKEKGFPPNIEVFKP